MRFDEAWNELTELQRQVLDAVTDEPQTAKEVAIAADLHTWRVNRGGQEGRGPVWYPAEPDIVTARNTLGWLAAKGSVEYVNGAWVAKSPSVPNGSIERELPRAA